MDWVISIADAVSQGVLPELAIKELSKEQFCATESSCLDFKRDGYSDDAASMAEAIKDIASFYNSYGGFVVFGVEEIERDVRYKVVGIKSTPFDMQVLKGRVGAWLSDDIPFAYNEIGLECGVKVGVLFIPKRAQVKPNEFIRRGPELKPGKYAFDAGDVAVRRVDKSTLARDTSDWQLVLGQRELDKIAMQVGRLMPERHSGAALDHNLPSRSVICVHFVGRLDVLTNLWGWLNDRFQYAKVIAGEGGRGKTSVAYEFATQVAHAAPLGIRRVVWLTAKRKLFSGIENTWRNIPETHFGDFRSLLVALGLRIGYLEEELEGASNAELHMMVRGGIAIQPTLFVLDDIDSLELNDQRLTLEFAQQCGSEFVRFLSTTRSNASYSSSAAITLEGLAGADYVELVGVYKERYGVSLNEVDIASLEKATIGSPLLTESILRVFKRGSSLKKALEEWRGQSGEDARNAVLGREIAQLSREAKRVLLCLAFLGQCSKAELLSASGVLEVRLGDALEELQSLFILNAPKIIESEPRFEVSVTTALLVISKRAELAGDHVALEKYIRTARSKAAEGVGQKHNKHVAIAISQALALLKSRKYEEAVETIDAGLRVQKNHSDLLTFKARLLVSEAHPPQYSLARDILSRAYEAGGRKHVLFDLWYKCERALLFGHGLVELAESALKEFPNEEALWAERRAEGYVLNGLARMRNKESDQAYSELSNAAKELCFALRKASDADISRLNELMIGVHDKLLEMLPETSPSFRGDSISLIREITDRGDVRTLVLDALVKSLFARFFELPRKGPDERFSHNLAYAIDVLHSAGPSARHLYRKVLDLSGRIK